MPKRLYVIALLFVLFSSIVRAACPPLPNPLINGSTANANDVMTDLNSILSCPLFTGNIGIYTSSPIGAVTANTSGANSLSIGINTNAANSVAQILGSALAIGYNSTSEAITGAVAWDFYNNGSSPSWAGAYLSHWGTGTTGNFYGVPAANQGSLIFQNENAGVIGSNGANIIVAPGSTPLATFQSSGTVGVLGRLGIGTSTPGYTLHVNGSVAGVGAYNNVSDVRLKKQITKIDDALAIIQNLRGVRFRWRTPEERTVGKALHLPVAEPQIGLIAQEVKAVLPEATSVSANGEAIMSLQESKIVPVLIEAVKQLKQANDQEAAEIKSLKTAINNLQRKVGIQTAGIVTGK